MSLKPRFISLPSSAGWLCPLSGLLRGSHGHKATSRERRDSLCSIFLQCPQDRPSHSSTRVGHAPLSKPVADMEVDLGVSFIFWGKGKLWGPCSAWSPEPQRAVLQFRREVRCVLHLGVSERESPGPSRVQSLAVFLREPPGRWKEGSAKVLGLAPQGFVYARPASEPPVSPSPGRLIL